MFTAPPVEADKPQKTKTEPIAKKEKPPKTKAKKQADDKALEKRKASPAQQDTEKTSLPLEGNDFYELFLARIKSLCATSPQTVDALLQTLPLHKTQLNAWLKQAVSDKKLKKLTKPVRYQWLAKEPDLFAQTEECV